MGIRIQIVAGAAAAASVGCLIEGDPSALSGRLVNPRPLDFAAARTAYPLVCPT